jgi:hypothetical protein
VGTEKPDPDDKRNQRDGWITIITWVMALEGINLLLWICAAIVFTVFIILVVVASKH